MLIKSKEKLHLLASQASRTTCPKRKDDMEEKAVALKVITELELSKFFFFFVLAKS